MNAWRDDVLTLLFVRVCGFVVFHSCVQACVAIVICGDVLGPQAEPLGAAVMPVLLSLTHCGNTTMQARERASEFVGCCGCALCVCV